VVPINKDKNCDDQSTVANRVGIHQRYTVQA
jgi:hypothetical protein